MFSCGEKPQKKEVDIEWTQAKSAKMGKNLTLDEEIDIKLHNLEALFFFNAYLSLPCGNSPQM